MGRQGTPRTDASRASLAHRVGAYVSAHRLRRRWLALMGVLAAVVVVVTAGALTMPASTMTADMATLPEGASVPEGYTQQYTAKDEVNGITVTAYAPEGVVPEGATLKASLLAQDSDEYAAAKQATGATDEEGTGFAAMDISFADADGNEVEPTGDVYVNIDVAGILPEDADPKSVTVQHLAEDETGAVASVDTVADTAEDTEGVATAVDTTNVRAAFSVDGFSTFTITWEQGWNNEHPINFTCYYTGTSQELPTLDRPGNFTMRNGQTVDFSKSDYDSRLNIDGYTYDRAEYRIEDYDSWQPLNELGVSKAYHGWNYYVNGDEVSGEPQVRLYYTKNSSGGGEGGGIPGGTTTENATVQTGKTAVLRDDGNYDLTLSISGDRGSATSPAPVDVLFIVDKSGSMSGSRMNNTHTAMNTLVDSLEGNANIDARYSIVTFSGTSGNDGSWNDKGDAAVVLPWTAVSGNNVSNVIGSISANGGTDYQAGLDVGTDQLNNARQGATKVVIFLSDGEPTWSYNYGNGGDALDRTDDGWGSTYQGWVETLNQAKMISCDYFYAVGIGTSANDYLDDLVRSVTATTKQQIKAATDGSNLKNLFNDIAANVTFFAAQNVKITDPLSEYADLVLTNNVPQFTVSVTNGTTTWSDTVAPGNSVTFYDADGKAQTATPRVSNDNRIIYLVLPENYQLEEGYSYSISTIITPSQKAIDEGIGSDAAKQEPDVGTGTHADNNEQGFWSNDNDNAIVSYTANGQDGSEKFPKPVIRVQAPKTGSLTITKAVSGASADSKVFNVTISTRTNVSSATPMNGSTKVDFSDTDGDGTYTASVPVTANTSTIITGLPLGSYSVTENTDDVAIEGHRFDGVVYSSSDGDDDGTSGVCTLNENAPEASVGLTNSYTQVTNIRVHKTDSSGKDLVGALFTLTNDEGEYYKAYDSTTGEVEWSTGDQVTLSFDESNESLFNISGLENGTYTLTEVQAPAGYQMLSDTVTITVTGGHVTISKASGVSLDEDNSNTIRVTNSAGEILPNTGGSGNTPLILGGLLLVAAAGCGYGLRRRHEGRGARS